MQQIKNFALAKNDFTKAISLNLKTAEVYYKRGICFYEVGDQRAACNDFKILAEFNKKTSIKGLKSTANRVIKIGTINPALSFRPRSKLPYRPAMSKEDSSLAEMTRCVWSSTRLAGISAPANRNYRHLLE